MKEGGRRIRVKEGDVTMEAEVRAMYLLALKMEGGRELRNVGSLWKLEKSRKMAPPKTSERNAALPKT